MTFDAEKGLCFYLKRGFEVPEAVQAHGLPGGGVFEKEDDL